MSNLNKNFKELLNTRTGYVNTSSIAPRARGAGARGGMPVATNSELAAILAEKRMRGIHAKNEQDIDPTGEKLASVFAEAIPVNLTYKGRKAENWVQPGFTEGRIEENILSNNAPLETSPYVHAAFNQLKAEKAAIKPISNQSPEFQGRKKLDEIYYKFFLPTGVYSKIGRELFNLYDAYMKTGDQSGLNQYLSQLIYNGYPVSYASGLGKYVKLRYNELKDHYAYYDAKVGSGKLYGGKRTFGKRKQARTSRKYGRRRKVTRRK